MGVLPFDKTGDLVELDGTPVVGHTGVRLAVWPAKGSRSVAGQVYDHEGECPLSELPQLRGRNRAFLVGGVTYRIVQAVEAPMIPHVALMLREVRPNA